MLELLTGRSVVKLTKIEGTIEPVNTTTGLPFPLVKHPTGKYIGLSSGLRSAIINIEGRNYKIKGYDLYEALTTPGVYSKSRTGSPYGGQTLEEAIRDIEFTFSYNELMRREGFRTSQEPEAIIKYGKKFNAYPTLASKVKRIAALSFVTLLSPLVVPWSPQTLTSRISVFQKGEIASSVTIVKGDTRLPEIYRLDPFNQEAAEEVAYRLGLMAGAQKRISEQEFTWFAGNSHVGNYVLFFEEGELNLNMCDFSSARELDFRARMMFWGERKQVFETLKSHSYNLVEGFPKGGETAGFFVDNFTSGFLHGYNNPDRRQVITSADLQQAYGITAPAGI